MITRFLFNKIFFHKFSLRYLFLTIIILILSISFSKAAEEKNKDEKDCIYCKKYEKLKEWPKNERPEAFIYEEIDYPEGMFHKNRKTSKDKQKGLPKICKRKKST